MTKEEYLAIAAKRYDELQALNRIDNFYDYEISMSDNGSPTGNKY